MMTRSAEWNSDRSAVSIFAREYPSAIRTKKNLDHLLEQFETGQNRSVGVQQSLETMTQSLGKQLHELEELLKENERTMEKGSRELWFRRLKSLRDDLDTFRLSLKTQLSHIYRVREDEKERRRLLGGRTLAKRKEVTDTMESISSERQRLNESSQMLDIIAQQGKRITTNLFGQNMTLKRAQKKLLYFRNTLGVSTSLIGVIERRHGLDRLLVYGCMVLTILIFSFLYYFIRLRPKWYLNAQIIEKDLMQ